MAKRQRTTLVAADVNVQRRDSTVFLIGGQPFYAVGAVIEKKSSVLADALRNAATLDPIALPLPSGVAADERYATFRAAVEHAYTGGVADAAAASLLPLWCLGDHLQMDELCAWCIERIAPCLAADAALLEAAWAAALARPCDSLCDACARAWLRLNAANEEYDAVLQLLLRMQAGCGAGAAPAAQLVRVLRAALQARSGRCSRLSFKCATMRCRLRDAQQPKASLSIEEQRREPWLAVPKSGVRTPTREQNYRGAAIADNARRRAGAA
jgi:hypothetical protein